MFYFLFIEITKHDLLVIGGTIFTLFLGAGAVALAFKNIREQIISPVYKFCFEPRVIRRRQINELVVNFPKLTESIAKIEHEVLTNSGSSMKDSMIRIEKNHVWFFSKFRHNDQIAHEALFESDEKGNLIFVNRSLCELLAVAENDLLNRAWLMRIEPGCRERVKNEWKEAIDNKIPLESRQTVIDPRDGELFEIRVHAQPHLDGQSNLIGFFGHVQIVK